MPVRWNREFEYSLFFLHFLNKDISFKNHDGHLEGSVSQILYLGPSFHFMKSRKKSFEKCQKVTRFCFFLHKIETNA